VRFRRPQCWNDWQPRHDQRLRELAGTMPLPQIAATLLEEFGIPRTLAALRTRCASLGVSQHPGWTLREVARLCGVHHGTVSRWIREGLLPAAPVQPGPSVTQWWIRPAALEAFLRAYPERLDWQRMPVSRYRALVEIEWRRDPFWTRLEVQQRTGASPAAVIWAQRHGRLPAVRSHRWSQWGGQWLYRRSAVFAWQRRAQEASA
jgi:excisionase family DNA binding protein